MRPSAPCHSIQSPQQGCSTTAPRSDLTLIYGMRLLPEGEVTEINDTTLRLANGHEAHVTMQVIENAQAD